MPRRWQPVLLPQQPTRPRKYIHNCLLPTSTVCARPCVQLCRQWSPQQREEPIGGRVGQKSQSACQNIPSIPLAAAHRPPPKLAKQSQAHFFASRRCTGARRRWWIRRVACTERQGRPASSFHATGSVGQSRAFVREPIRARAARIPIAAIHRFNQRVLSSSSSPTPVSLQYSTWQLLLSRTIATSTRAFSQYESTMMNLKDTRSNANYQRTSFAHASHSAKSIASSPRTRHSAVVNAATHYKRPVIHRLGAFSNNTSCSSDLVHVWIPRKLFRSLIDHPLIG